MPDTAVIILPRDLNIHHIKWLPFSNCNLQQGADLKAVCGQFTLQQLVNKATRQEYLLDLSLTDISSMIISRRSFKLAKANLRGLEDALNQIDWYPLKRGCGNDAATYCMELLRLLLCMRIPYEGMRFKRNHIRSLMTNASV